MDLMSGLQGLSTVMSIANSGMNIYGAFKQDKRQDEANEYTKYLNNLQMQREDDALQRRLADVKAAGFSPLVAANLGGAGTGSFTQLGTASGDYSGAFQGLADNLQGVSNSLLAKKQQKFAEKQWEDEADLRDYNKQLKGIELAKAAIDLQSYAEEKNLNMDSLRLANELSQSTLDSADQMAKDAHAESAERVLASKQTRAYQRNQIKLIAQDITESGERIAKMKKEGEYIDKQKAYTETMTEVQDAIKQLHLNEDTVFKRLDALGKAKGYNNFQEYYYANLGKQQVFDNVVKVMDTAVNAAQVPSKYIK